ncbi:MAG: Vitamin B12 import ATP-binding protein BtuD [Gemmatimonadaceae bacterium]|nr:Vitamin B12 import ATP-binding protein BtuD [Gemmatimonadaceae bacterium]
MIDVTGLSARAGDFWLRDVTFTVPASAYGVVIGPAGSGKTTLLETIAGIVPAHTGRLRLGSRDAGDLPPEARQVALAYQHAFLFPHLTVRENVSYGAASGAEADEMARRFDVVDLLDRSVRGLSGGERQLVSIARTLARGAPYLLLDEPFSALDPRRRARTRREVRALHKERGLTVLQVTHDFTEAGMLGDVAILLDGGRVLQYGPPEEVFRKPASPYIAEFLGAENVYAGIAHVVQDRAPDWAEGTSGELSRAHHAVEFRSGSMTIYAVSEVILEGPTYAVVRGEDVVLSLVPHTTSARNTYEGVISEVVTTGALSRVTLTAHDLPIVASLTTRSVQELGLTVGVRAHASFKALAVHLC